jgi:hypothetical protein
MRTAFNKVLDFISSDSPWFLVAFASVVMAELALLMIFFPPR